MLGQLLNFLGEIVALLLHGLRLFLLLINLFPMQFGLQTDGLLKIVPLSVHFLRDLILIQRNLIRQLILLYILLLPLRLLHRLPHALVNQVLVEHLVQEGRHPRVKYKFSLQLHR
jgi:hypothetical protein